MKLAILVQHQKIICYGCDAAGRWSHLRIKGEASVDTPPGRSSTVLQQVLKDQSDRLNDAQALSHVEVHLVYAVSDIEAMNTAPKVLADLQCQTWQILRLEPLVARAASMRGYTPSKPLEENGDWLKAVLLPILTSTFAYANVSFKAEEARALQAHEETMESLRAEREAKSQEIVQLQARIQALQLPGVEHLLVYLPAIYRNFWGVVRPDELALMAGTLTVPNVPSPHPDPSADTVLMLKRRFLQLPEIDRERVLVFCRGIQHRLDIRPEMRDLFGDI